MELRSMRQTVSPEAQEVRIDLLHDSPDDGLRRRARPLGAEMREQLDGGLPLGQQHRLLWNLPHSIDFSRGM
jgi:hypothetical protein